LKSSFHKHRYQFENTLFEKFISKILKWWWCGPFALGLIFSPPLALIAKKRRTLEPFYIFSPIDKRNISENYTNWRDGGIPAKGKQYRWS
jgi:hypothetical protein